MKRLADAGLLALLFGAAAVALLAGTSSLSARDVMSGLFGGPETTAGLIVWGVRMPRLLLALSVGAALAAAGAALQALLANPMAEPFLLGISGGGAAAATAAWVVLPVAALGLVPAAAMVGAAVATAAVWWMAHGPMGPSSTRMILAGVAVNAATSAIILTVLALAPSPRLPGALAVTMGSFAGASGPAVAWMVPYLVVPFAVLLHHGRDLSLLLTGEESAVALGVDMGVVRRRVFLAAAALSGAAVAFAGVIGFVGLVTPHLCRLVWGPQPRGLLPRAAVAGAALTALGDVVARTALSPAELPVGVVTAVLGVPLFVALLRRAA